MSANKNVHPDHPLKVTVAQGPGDYRWPDIERAVGSGERVELVPEQVGQSAWVIVPDIILEPGERIFVQWNDPAEYGSWRPALPDPAGSRRYRIPNERVAPHLGRVFPVKYEVKSGEVFKPSQVRQLYLLDLDKDQLPMLSCEGITEGSLSLATILASGAKLRLAVWPLIATNQRVRITLAGINAVGEPIEYPVLADHRVTSYEVTAGIGSTGDVTASRYFMEQLQLNAPFSLVVYVSFDDGTTWPPVGAPNFPVNSSVTLVE